MISDSRSLQSEIAVSSCPGSPGWETCCHSMSQKRRLAELQLQRIRLIMLLGLVEVDYKFIWADVRSNGAASDTQIFLADSKLKEAIENDVISFPPADQLPNDDRETPYFIIGDDAFSLRTWMMKPYGRCGLPVPERIFNYWLFRARRIVENAFGILSNRFGCLLTTLKQQPLVVVDVILSCICLHNLMQKCSPGCHGNWTESKTRHIHSCHFNGTEILQK